MRHLISPLDFSVEELDKLLDLADDIEKNPAKFKDACKGKKLATLFYEPSTRTRLSFESAMLNLGGGVLGFSSADSSSASKGESVADTIRIISCVVVGKECFQVPPPVFNVPVIVELALVASHGENGSHICHVRRDVMD